MPAPPIIQELVDRCHDNRVSYKAGNYNEAQVRQEFIDPFFVALGWDIANRLGYAETYKDVIHEHSIKIGNATKAPDYCFQIGGKAKFYLEAEKPAVNIKEDISPAYQLRRYAWSAKLPLSALTDFEEFAVYDLRVLSRTAGGCHNGRRQNFFSDCIYDTALRIARGQGSITLVTPESPRAVALRIARGQGSITLAAYRLTAGYVLRIARGLGSITLRRQRRPHRAELRIARGRGSITLSLPVRSTMRLLRIARGRGSITLRVTVRPVIMLLRIARGRGSITLPGPL